MKIVTTIEELLEILESGEYPYYGLRNATNHDIKNVRRGYLDCSYDWIDNVRTDERLSGTCAISVGDFLNENEIMRRYNRCLKVYPGTDTILLIADDQQEYGEDENEVILGHDGFGADVVAIVEL